MRKVLVTPRSITSAGGHPALAKIAEAGYELVYCTPGQLPNEEELATLLPGCAGYIAGVESIGGVALEGADQLRVISRNGVGVDKVDTGLLERLGIELQVAEGANARGVAELTMGLLLATTRSISVADRGLKAGQWPRRKGVELQGQTLGVIGFGHIGRTVARMAAAMGMKVVVYDPFVDSFDQLATIQLVELDELFRVSDMITFHCPPSSDGSAILDRGAIAKLKEGVYLINTARYELIDTDAALDGLEAGVIAGFGIDVYDQEPPEMTPLLMDDRVVTTSHIGGYTRQSVDRAVTAAAENLLAVLEAPAELGSHYG